MPKRPIQILPDLLLNQIAAGEVVERPSSIVKELLENSLDAGAKTIEIRVEEGGLQSITLRDDGAGIPRDELLLAITPHATSKIYSLDELEDLHSLGFRGEALASIASVSRFSLKSREIGAETAWKIAREGKGEVPEIKPTALAEGTEVDVRDLFFNTPARRKFLKTQATEFSHIEEVVRRLALSHTDVAMSLYHNHKPVLQVTGGESNKRLSALCGKHFAEHTTFIQTAKTGLSLEGWLVQPKYLKRSANHQYFYVNGRPIRDKLIIHAIKEGYRDVLYGDHQPDYVLFLEVDPKSVDFNVHPAKLEVRFREGRLLHDFVRSEIKKALAESSASGGVESLSHCVTASLLREPTTPELETSDLIRRILPPLIRGEGDEVDGGIRQSQYPESGSSKSLSHCVTAPLLREPTTPEFGEVQAFTDTSSFGRFGRAICQLKGLFILAEHAEGLMLIDMHAAHERVLYERLKRDWQQNAWERQILLFPYAVALSRQEAVIFKEHQDKLGEMGIIADEWLDHKVMIREVPVVLAKSNIEKFMRDLLRDLDLLGQSNQTAAYFDEILAEIACHGAIQAHQTLSLTEMNALLKDMAMTPNIAYCNHGRPTSRLLKTDEIGRLFLRGR